MYIKEVFRPVVSAKTTTIVMFSESVQAGFPSPAQDYMDKALSLDELCIRTPAATFFVKASGNSMEHAGIHDGDILVVDRSLPATHKKIVIATLDGDFLCKRLDLSNPDKPVLRAESDDYPDIFLSDGEELEVFGVVTTVVHPV